MRASARGGFVDVLEFGGFQLHCGQDFSDVVGIISCAHCRLLGGFDDVGKSGRVIFAKIGKPVVGEDDLCGLVFVKVDRDSLDRFPAECLRGLPCVVSCEDFVRDIGFGAFVDDDWPVLSSYLQAFRDFFDVSTAGVAVIRSQIANRKRFNL